LNTSPLPSTRPYLIRALHRWCMDHGFTPYLSVVVDGSVRVPRQHVVDGEIVLNVSTDATGGLNLGDEFIEFKARFGGVAQQVVVPVERVSAIYARENGQGMAFPVQAATSMIDGAQTAQESEAGQPLALVDAGPAKAGIDTKKADPTGKPPGGSRPALKRIK
jgi:stringent starvation protein B